MRTRRSIQIVAIAIITLLVVGFVLMRSSIRDPRNRIEHEHGLRLPASASAFECRGDAAKGFLDRGASSAFIITSSDLAGFISQLKIQKNLVNSSLAIPSISFTPCGELADRRRHTVVVLLSGIGWTLRFGLWMIRESAFVFTQIGTEMQV